MRVVITGAGGFVGRYLVELLAGACEVIGIDRNPGPGVRQVFELPAGRALAVALKEIQPHAIVHLAAFSSVAAAEREPELCHRINVLGTQDLLEASLAPGAACRFIYISSCTVYGSVPASEQPITESQRVHPTSVYSRSKLAAEQTVERSCTEAGRPWLIFRPFNHFGPRQQPTFVLASLAKQIAELERGKRPAILTAGNLEVRRDFLDVRDVVEAYRVAVNGSLPNGVYNLASGTAHPLADLLRQLADLAKVDFTVSVSPSLVRENDQELLLGDSSRFRQATRWRPRFPLRQSLSDLLEYFRHASA